MSLVRQIEGAIKKGCKSSEDVDAVVSVINRGMRLGNYLKGRGDLTLSRLRR